MRTEDDIREPGSEPVKTAAKLLAVLTLLVALLFGVDWILQVQNFPVRDVRFEGAFAHVTEEQLESAVIGVVRSNFFLVDLEAVKQRVEALPWIYRASVRRHWPRDIYVNFSEQNLVAHWGNTPGRATADSGATAWLNESGEVVRLASDAAAPDLPWLDGPEGTAPQVLASYRKFEQELEPAGLKLTELELTPRRSWRLDLDANGRTITAVLDREESDKKVSRFARAYAEELGRQARAIKQVDLRYANGFSVQWDQDAVTGNELGARERAAAYGDARARVRAGTRLDHVPTPLGDLPDQSKTFEDVAPGRNGTTQAAYEG